MVIFADTILSTMYIVYGIPNCDTIKKTIGWLQKNKITYQFYDYKKKGITPAKLKAWSKQVGWESLVNKKGSTWRQLSQATQITITNEKAAIGLLVENTSAIKRPVIEKEGKVITVGFDEQAYKDIFT